LGDVVAQLVKATGRHQIEEKKSLNFWNLCSQTDFFYIHIEIFNEKQFPVYIATI
jgi:hypothetical protein